MPSWSQDSIREALARQASNGRAVVTLPSPRDAQLFRTAVYNFLRREGSPRRVTLRAAGCDVVFEPRASSREPLHIASDSEVF